MEENFEKELEKEVTKIEVDELIGTYKKVEEFINYLEKEQA